MVTPHRTLLILALAVLAASQSANLIRLGGATPAVVVAAWRLLLASAALAPFAAQGLKTQLRTPRERLLVLLTGVLLTLHFVTWIAGVQRTSVANATMLFSVNPIMTALGGVIFFKERVSSRLALSIVLGIGGMLVLGASDIKMKPEGLPGDALSMISAVFFSGYLLLGRHLRQATASLTYVFAVYLTAGLLCTLLAWTQRTPMLGYDTRAWLCFVLMAAVPTLIGHTGINYAVRYLAAAKISVASLSEPLFAALVAAWVWNEPIAVSAIAGYLLIVSAVVVLFVARAGMPLRPASAGRKDGA